MDRIPRSERGEALFGPSLITCRGRFDMYVPFVELGTRVLRSGGRFGMITPSNFFLRDYGQDLRWFLLHESTIEVVDSATCRFFPVPRITPRF